MSEKFKLFKKIENFIDNNCEFKKNETFTINLVNEKEKTDQLPIVQDGSNLIQCIMNIPKDKENLLKEAEKKGGIKINVTDSSFEFVLYKNPNTPSVIKCLLLLIVNDFEKNDETIEEEENKKNASDINNEYKLLEKLKKFIFNFIKKNKKNKNNNQDKDTSGNVLENILLGGAKDGIKFFNHDNNGINYEEERIKNIIDIIKGISSKLEIKQKKNETDKNDNVKNKENEKGKESTKKGKKDTDKVINEVLDELNPDYKNELIDRYLDEMPEEIVNLMKKYKNIYFTQNMYNEYINNKNINNGEDNKEIEDKKENLMCNDEI